MPIDSDIRNGIVKGKDTSATIVVVITPDQIFTTSQSSEKLWQLLFT